MTIGTETIDMSNYFIRILNVWIAFLAMLELMADFLGDLGDEVWNDPKYCLEHTVKFLGLNYLITSKKRPGYWLF